jgi:hypothetical protein
VKQWNIIGVFEICFSDDAGLPAMGTLLMGNGKLFNAQNGKTSFSKMVAGGRPHGTCAYYNMVIVVACH